MAGTLMAVSPDAPKVDRFITLGGEPQLLRYNSRLPLVVYVPGGVEVRSPDLAGRAGCQTRAAGLNAKSNVAVVETGNALKSSPKPHVE